MKSNFKELIIIIRFQIHFRFLLADKIFFFQKFREITCVAAAGSLAIFLADCLADLGKETTIELEDGEDSGVDSITEEVDNDGNAGKELVS